MGGLVARKLEQTKTEYSIGGDDSRYDRDMIELR